MHDHSDGATVVPTGAATDVLAADVPETKPAPWLLVIGVGVLVLALVGGITYGLRALSGGGAQPEDALPAGAFAFAEIDLDPPAGQKLDAFRFLRQFPALRDKLDGDDLRRVVFEAIAEDAGWDEIDYDSQVAPWLGQRLAVAAYPGDRFGGQQKGGQENSGDMPGLPAAPDVVVALQVTDEGKARDGLARLVEASRDGAGDAGTGPGAGPPGYVVSGDYALLAETRAVAEEALSAAGDGALASSADFAADMDRLGDGVASAWVDMAAAGGLAAFANPLVLGSVGSLAGVTTTAGGSGRAAYVLRFDGPDAVEVAGQFTDAEQIRGIGSASLQGMGDLPAGTVAAFGLAGGDQLVEPMLDSLREQVEAMGGSWDEMVAEAEQQLGITLPEDLQALLGSNLLMTLDSAGLERGELSVGARAVTDPGRAGPVVDRLTRLLQQAEPDVRSEVTGDGYVIGSDPSALRRLQAAAGDGLDGRDAFRRALPDVAGARMALWLDPRPLVRGLAFSSEEEDPNLAPLAGFGMTVATGEDGSGSFRMRLVTD